MYQGEVLDDLEEAKPNRCRTCLYYTWKVFTCIFSHIILVSLVVAYCILGAYTFESLESLNELKVKKDVLKLRSEVTDILWDLTREADVLVQEQWTKDVRGQLSVFETKLLTAMKKDGWDGSEDDQVQQWTFTGALFYSIIVITTIGYGHIAPKTPGGKVVTIFYAILGIPLMLLCLSNIGDIMAHSFRFLYWRVCCYMCTRKPKRPPSRRGRSVRSGTVRASSSGRLSGRSRGQSLKHPSQRTSTRSADSALGLSISMTRSSYSDTDCRYHEDPDLALDGGQFRASQHSRYSDTAVSLRTGDLITPTSSIRSKAEAPRPAPDSPQTPVLFNKYALDRDESMRAHRPARFAEAATLPRQQSQPSSQYQSSPYGGSLRRQLEVDRPDVPTPPPPPPMPPSASQRSSRKGPNTSPRIMSPMGYGPTRQNVNRARLARLREDMDYNLEYEEEYETNSGSQRQSKTKPVPIWLCVFLVVSYIFGGAFLFSHWETWHFLDSAYFCFITLTTIGFGDFVPAQRVNEPELSIALCSLYLLFGIALLAMSFNLVQEEVINNVKAVAKRLGIIKDDEDEED